MPDREVPVACEECALGPCDLCGLCCRECECEPLEEPAELELGWDLSDMEDDRYFWDR